MNRLETSVAMIVFNRPETTKRVFEAVAAIRPTRLFLIADGPRSNVEEQRCNEVRKIVSKVDWPCKVEADFAAQNLGCKRRVISGLNWVFSQVDEAIILEDDCLPDPSFFPFCTELLERYRSEEQIGFIAGSNCLQRFFPFQYSYCYSFVSGIWGWATWRRAWQAFDETMQSWPEVKTMGGLSPVFPDADVASYWLQIFDLMYEGKGPNTWDYQWLYTCWTRNWLSVLPSRNLVENLGFGAGATHTSVVNPDLICPRSPISFPLDHPPAITPWHGQAAWFNKMFYRPSLLRKLRQRWLSKMPRRTA